MYEAGEALQFSSTATVVRQREGQTMSTDGPFAETKEQLGGYYQISCENLDEAIEAASQIPTVARGEPVEVRPIQEFPEQPSRLARTGPSTACSGASRDGRSRP